jgi:hypothetical protein
MENLAKERLPLQLCRDHLSFALLINFKLVKPSLISFLPKGENLKGSQDSLFLVINAKGGEFIGPKQKDRTTTHFKIFKNYFTKRKKLFQLVSVSQKRTNHFNCKNPLDS